MQVPLSSCHIIHIGNAVLLVVSCFKLFLSSLWAVCDLVTETLRFMRYDFEEIDHWFMKGVNFLKHFFSKSEAKAPDPQDRQNQTIVINKARCPQNHPCPSIRVCSVGALSQNGYAAPIVDMQKCIKCGKCIKYCPMHAIDFQ